MKTETATERTGRKRRRRRRRRDGENGHEETEQAAGIFVIKQTKEKI
jgi:hypothetical protein